MHVTYRHNGARWFFSANNHCSTYANQFCLHAPAACRNFAASILLRTPGTHEYIASGTILPTININLFNIHTWAILDSGATSNVLVTMAPKSSVSPTNNPLRVSLPNGDQVQLTCICTLVLPQFPTKARCGHIVPGLAAYLLLSVVRLYDLICDVIFTKIVCTVPM